MARYLRCLRTSVFSDSSPSIAYRNPKIGLPTVQNRNFLIGGRCLSSGSYVSEMQKSAFQGNICRLIRNEIDYELNHSPPLQVMPIKLDTLIIPFQWQKGRYFTLAFSSLGIDHFGCICLAVSQQLWSIHCGRTAWRAVD